MLHESIKSGFPWGSLARDAILYSWKLGQIKFVYFMHFEFECQPLYDVATQTNISNPWTNVVCFEFTLTNAKLFIFFFLALSFFCSNFRTQILNDEKLDVCSFFTPSNSKWNYNNKSIFQHQAETVDIYIFLVSTREKKKQQTD